MLDNLVVVRRGLNENPRGWHSSRGFDLDTVIYT